MLDNSMPDKKLSLIIRGGLSNDRESFSAYRLFGNL